jgi:hypothetical protein
MSAFSPQASDWGLPGIVASGQPPVSVGRVADRFTRVRRILIVRTAAANTLTAVGGQATAPASPPGERCIGQLSTAAILSTIEPKVRALSSFEQSLQARVPAFNELSAEISAVLDSWRAAFNDALAVHSNERAAKVDLTPELLRRWFGDALLQQPLEIVDLEQPRLSTSFACLTIRTTMFRS